MKRMILAPLLLLVGCGTALNDPGAQRTTASEARTVCRNGFGNPSGERGEEVERFIDVLFIGVRVDRDNGLSEQDQLLAAVDGCGNDADPLDCVSCAFAVVASVYDE